MRLEKFINSLPKTEESEIVLKNIVVRTNSRVLDVIAVNFCAGRNCLDDQYTVCFNIGAMLCELDFISLKNGKKSIYYSKMLKTYKDESFDFLSSDKFKDSEVNYKETFNKIFK